MSHTISLLIIFLIVVALIGAIIRIYNRLVFFNHNTQKAFANIEVLLKQRSDEIPNLITIVKEYAKYEKETLHELTAIRTKCHSTEIDDEKVVLYNDMGKAMTRVMMVAENYPDLKANESFLLLQHRISELENSIADRREFFNDSVNMYNIGITEFPSLIMAKAINYRSKSLLVITKSEKKYDGITI